MGGLGRWQSWQPLVAAPPCACRGLMRATLHLVNREFEALADDFVTLGMLPKTEVRGWLAWWSLGMRVCSS